MRLCKTGLALCFLLLIGCAHMPTPVGMELYTEGGHSWGRTSNDGWEDQLLKRGSAYVSTDRGHFNENEIRMGISVYFDLTGTGKAKPRLAAAEPDWEWVDCEEGDTDFECVEVEEEVLVEE